MPVSRLLATPRPVVLAGRAYLAAPLRVRDLGALEAFAAAATPWPPDALPPRDDPGWLAAFRAAWHACGPGGPADVAWGSPACKAALAAPGGLALFVHLCLARHQPEVDVAAAAAVVAGMAPGDWDALGRVAWGVDALDELEALLGPRGDDGRPPVDWERAVYEVARDLGCGYEAALDMTLAAFCSARRGGTPKQRGRELRDGEDPEAARREQYRRFHGCDPPAAAASGARPPARVTVAEAMAGVAPGEAGGGH